MKKLSHPLRKKITPPLKLKKFKFPLLSYPHRLSNCFKLNPHDLCVLFLYAISIFISQFSFYSYEIQKSMSTSMVAKEMELGKRRDIRKWGSWPNWKLAWRGWPPLIHGRSLISIFFLVVYPLQRFSPYPFYLDNRFYYLDSFML